MGIMGYILGLYWDNGKEKETTIMGYIGIIGYRVRLWDSKMKLKCELRVYSTSDLYR